MHNGNITSIKKKNKTNTHVAFYMTCSPRESHHLAKKWSWCVYIYIFMCKDVHYGCSVSAYIIYVTGLGCGAVDSFTTIDHE